MHNRQERWCNGSLNYLNQIAWLSNDLWDQSILEYSNNIEIKRGLVGWNVSSFIF